MKMWSFSRAVGLFTGDSRALLIMISGAFLLAGWIWLQQNPQHDPLSPLDLNDPPGWATAGKLEDLAGNRSKCLQVLSNSDVKFTALPGEGDGPCGLPDRTQIGNPLVVPAGAIATCPVNAGLALWLNHGVQQAAEEHLGTKVTRILHLGTTNCRRMNSSQTAPWSEHASANAIDISGFVLANGEYVSVLQHWGAGEKGAFLEAVRDSACSSFRTVLSPEYNAEHADHFHLDQGTRWARVCR